ncbi:MAG: HYExAFE family protein [Thermoguttaceae bacterium]|nr:hypothetical protein [Planctomycetaceae bacterium]MBQ4144654.1 HYExAFE family protein [Thermoguttaceae bacterium]
MKKNNHYERAFEAYVRSLGRPCLAMNERYRSLDGEEQEFTLKSFDFILPPHLVSASSSWSSQEAEQGAPFFYVSENSSGASEIAAVSWLVDIKGRRFPTGERHPQYWKNWVNTDDIQSLSRWENIFGTGFHGLFVFVYDVCGTRYPVPEEQLFEFEDKRYAFFLIPLAVYRDLCRPLSARWRTVTMPTKLFRQYAASAAEFF